MPSAAQMPTAPCQERTRRSPFCLSVGRSIWPTFRAFLARITQSPTPATAMMPNHEAASSL